MPCFWACLYLSGGVAGMLPHADHGPSFYRPFDINNVENPYGMIEAGWSSSYGKWDFEVAARHESSIAVDVHYHDFQHQYGQNSLEIRARWFPFR